MNIHSLVLSRNLWRGTGRLPVGLCEAAEPGKHERVCFVQEMDEVGGGEGVPPLPPIFFSCFAASLLCPVRVRLRLDQEFFAGFAFMRL